MAAADGDDGYLARVIRVLESFDSELRALKVSTIASTARLPLPTAYRIVGELRAIGFLARDPDGRIRLGARLWELANRGSPLSDPREAARSELDALHAATGLHTNLAVLRDGSVLVVDRIHANIALPNRSVTAARMPAIRSSRGRAMLALARELAERELGRGDGAGGAGRGDGADVGAAAAAAAADAAAAEERAVRELAQVRRAGYAVRRGMQDASTLGIAAPVFVARRVVAAVGLVAPIETSAGVERALGERVVMSAARIGEAMGRRLSPV